MTDMRVVRMVRAMREWAEAHPEADTQGLDDEEWYALASAALTGLGRP